MAATGHSQLESLAIHSLPEELMQGNSYTFEVEATYDDGTTKLVEANVSSSDPSIVKVEENGTVTTVGEGSVTLTAEHEGVRTELQVLVLLEINGHRLPPKPDPVVNDATLLGVDGNGNGVRDDVERWIYKHYQNKHPVYIDIAMQLARGYRKVLLMPERAKEIHDEVSAGVYCSWYYRNDAKYFGEPILVHEEIWSKITKVFFTTPARRNAYKTYDRALSGDSYTLMKASMRQKLCDFNTSKYFDKD